MRTKPIICTLAMLAATLTAAGSTFADPKGPAKLYTTGKHQTLIRPTKSECIGLGEPCRKNWQCCSGSCKKGHAEGVPGAWCDG
jgi:hypothetical protein